MVRDSMNFLIPVLIAKSVEIAWNNLIIIVVLFPAIFVIEKFGLEIALENGTTDTFVGFYLVLVSICCIC